MTRKEIIEEVLEAIKSDTILDGVFHASIAEQVLEAFAAQVEREVWEKVRNRCAIEYHDSMVGGCDFCQWVRSQQKGLA